MPELFVNPNLSNYFLAASEVNSKDAGKSFLAEYESGKVVTFPNIKIGIDFEFWSKINPKSLRLLKKFGSGILNNDMNNVGKHLESLVSAGIPYEEAEQIVENMRSIYRQIVPFYLSIFSGYEFLKPKAVWRLSTIMNENMHLDAYRDESEHYFARMFVNLDNQPRIWQTSWTIDEIMAMHIGKIDPRHLEKMTRGDVWAELNKVTFGGSSKEWWDGQPRHVCYFDPGDIWIVDSRQISHQIFYGRRALSIDFAVPVSSMVRQNRHYLELAEQFRAENARLQGA